jgi:LPS-assembly lipoprotein
MVNRGRKQENMVGKKTFFFIVFMGFYLTATACGFQPLYRHSGDSDPLAIGSVRILNIENRSGQKLRNFLLERLSQGRANKTKRYSLQVKLTESKRNLNLRKDGSATRAILAISAKFVLVENANGKKFHGAALSESSYNALDSEFATLSSENDARNRALRSIAEEIRLRVAAALKNPAVFPKPILYSPTDPKK